MRVYYAEAIYGEEEITAVTSVLRDSSTMLMDHDKVRQFEQKVCSIFGKEFGVMVNSGSSANLLAVSALELPPKSEVITPALTFSTTVAPIIQNQLIPAFVDVEEDTYNIQIDAIEELISENTKALMVPNLLGNLSDWTAIKSIADKYNLIIIEDSADTIGSKYKKGTTGEISDFVTTSFYGSHVITCGGFGGMICTNHIELYKRSKLLQGWGRNSTLDQDSETIDKRFDQSVDGITYDAKFIFSQIGYNFLPSELSAAFGLAQLRKLDLFIQKRIENFRSLYEYFEDYRHWFILPRQQQHTETAWLAFPLTVKGNAPFTRTDLQIYLETRGIQTRTIFSGNILRQPGFKHIPHRSASGGYPNADQVMSGGILIGCHQGIDNKQLEYICDVFHTFATKFSQPKIQ